MAERPSKAPKIVPAKNKTPAPIQITAEQLLREAKERQLEYVAPVSTIHLKLTPSLITANQRKLKLFFFYINSASEAKNQRSRRAQRVSAEETKRV